MTNTSPSNGLPTGNIPTEIETLNPSAAPESVLKTFDDSDAPFRLEKTVMDIWGNAEHKADLAEGIEEDGWTEEPIWCAAVAGINGKPFLYDGYTRLTVWMERRAAGIVEPLPKHKVRTFTSMEAVLEAVIKIQKRRRNTTAPQLVIAHLRAKELQGYAIAPKAQGRQSKKTKANGIALPSAKKLAEEIGVSDPVVRKVLDCWKYPDLIEKLNSSNPEVQITVTQAKNREKGKGRDEKMHRRAELLAKRRDRLAKMQAPNNPDVIEPNGIYTGDAIALMGRIKPNSTDLIFTSIPYACNVPYDVTPPFIGDLATYLDTFVRKPLTEAKRILRSGGRVALNFDDTYRSLEKQAAKDNKHLIPNAFNMAKEVSKIAEDELGLLFVGKRVWFKQNCVYYYGQGSTDCRYPLDNSNCEHIYIWAKDSVVMPCKEDESDLIKTETINEYNDFVVTHWYVGPQLRKQEEIDGKLNEFYHPVPMPEELAYRIIKLFCPTTGTVVDPFSGSGTTAFVAHALGRKYIGIDNSDLYNAGARKRLATLDGLSAEERRARITRFVPTARNDGYSTHNTLKPKTAKPAQESGTGSPLPLDPPNASEIADSHSGTPLESQPTAESATDQAA